MSSNFISAPIVNGFTSTWQAPWTDTIAGSSTLTKSIAVGIIYRSGTWTLIANDGGGAAVGTDSSGRAGYSGNIISSSSSTEAKWAMSLSGVYSSPFSSAVNTVVTSTRWGPTALYIRLNKVYFDGNGNVAFEFQNMDLASRALASVRAMVDVWL